MCPHIRFAAASIFLHRASEFHHASRRHLPASGSSLAQASLEPTALPSAHWPAVNAAPWPSTARIATPACTALSWTRGILLTSTFYSLPTSTAIAVDNLAASCGIVPFIYLSCEIHLHSFTFTSLSFGRDISVLFLIYIHISISIKFLIRN